MNWVEKRARDKELIEASIPRMFGYLCIAIEESAKSYTEHYRASDKATAAARRQGNCLHVIWQPDVKSEQNLPRERKICLFSPDLPRTEDEDGHENGESSRNSQPPLSGPGAWQR
jgi:hypothetical protein